MPKKCCGFCKHYELIGEGVTEYRGHISKIGFCPKYETLEELDDLAMNHDPKYGLWDEEYRWASHTACRSYEQDEVAYNDPNLQYLKGL